MDVVFGGECFEGRERELGAAGELQLGVTRCPLCRNTTV